MSTRQQLKGKRVIWPEQGKVAIEEFKVRKPEAEEILVKTRSTLVSPGTESAFLMALPNTSGKFPQYPGYCNAGEVIAIGNKINEIEVGNRVVSDTPHASYVLAREDRVFKMPQGLSFDEATFFNLSSTALQGIRKAGIEIGDSVVILGQGLVGQLALQLAKLNGAIPLVGVDLYDKRLDISFREGADYTLNPQKVNLEKEVKGITEGRGAKVVIEATGNPEAVSLSFKLASEFGRVVLLGSTRGESKVNFYSQVHRKGIMVLGAHTITRPKYETFHRWWTQQDDTRLVLSLLNKGLIKVKDLISLKSDFQEAPECYRKIIECKESVLGIILDWA